MIENKDEIMVSISCITYNQEKYVRKMIESLLMQKTNFKYEIVIHDDASTDNTANIIREYEMKYPNIIQPLYQTENQYSKGVSISSTFNYPRCNGKYIAFCEGDDYWSDPMKLQKQVDALEKREECAVCIHKVETVAEDESSILGYFPRYTKLHTGKIDNIEYLSLIVYTRTLMHLQFHLTSCMARAKYLKDYTKEEPEFKRIWDVGDIPLFLYLGTKGDAYYIDETMSCYRANAVGNWNSRTNTGIEKKKKHIEIECRALREFDKYSNYVVHDSIEKGIESRKFGIMRIQQDIKGMKSKEMREFYGLLSKKERFYIYIKKFCPWVLNLYKK